MSTLRASGAVVEGRGGGWRQSQRLDRRGSVSGLALMPGGPRCEQRCRHVSEGEGLVVPVLLGECRWEEGKAGFRGCFSLGARLLPGALR